MLEKAGIGSDPLTRKFKAGLKSSKRFVRVLRSRHGASPKRLTVRHRGHSYLAYISPSCRASFQHLPSFLRRRCDGTEMERWSLCRSQGLALYHIPSFQSPFFCILFVFNTWCMISWNLCRKKKKKDGLAHDTRSLCLHAVRLSHRRRRNSRLGPREPLDRDPDRFRWSH